MTFLQHVQAFLHVITFGLVAAPVLALPQAALPVPSMPPQPVPLPTLAELDAETAVVVASVKDLNAKAAADIAANPIPPGGMTREQLAAMIAAREPDQELPP